MEEELSNKKTKVKTSKNKEKEKYQMTDSTRNIIFNLLAFACIIIMAIAITPKSMQNDTFYNIKCGEYLVENGIFNQTQDPFSWHELSYTWPHWLFDILIFLLYSVCGNFWEVGIYIATMIFTTILGLSLYKLCLQMTKNNKVVSFIATLCGLYVMKPYIAARAQLLTFILFIWEIYFIEKLLETTKKRYGFGILGIAFLVVQLHCAVFPMIFVFAAPYVVEYLYIVLVDLSLDEKLFRLGVRLLKKFTNSKEKLEKLDDLIDKSLKNEESKKIKREKQRKNPYKVILNKNKAIITLIIFLVIAVLIGFINPMGTGAFTYTYKIYQGNTTDSINEHLPLTLADNEAYAVMLVFIIISLVLFDVKVRLSDLFMLAGTIFLSFNARRQVSLVVIMGMPILAKIISGFFEKYDQKLCDIIKKLVTSMVGIVITIGLVTLICQDIYDEKKNDEYINTNSYPVEASEWLISYMEENNISKEDLHLYNEYNYGSYLLFKDIPVFIDSRCDLYTPEFGSGEDIFSDALSVPGLNSDYENIFEKYDVRYVMLESDSNVNNNLKDDVNYDLLYDDGSFAIYKRLNAE